VIEVLQACEILETNMAKKKTDRQAEIVKLKKTGAECMTSSSMVNANAIQALHAKTFIGDGVQGIDFSTTVIELEKAIAKVRGGDISGLEAMLICQAQTLENVFLHFITRASNAEYLKNLDLYMHLALKAQNQSRATLATLAELKNPRRATFIKQQNNAVNQQVNNQTDPDSENRKISEQFANELLEQQHGERLDFGATATASGTDTILEAVGAIHRTKDA
jgi:HD superfamily phosphohydrolase